MSFKNTTFGNMGEDMLNQIKTREMVDYIRDRVTSKETKLRTRILPYDLKIAVSTPLSQLLN